ncbi:MAG: heavy metal translocating P-type ATPase [Hyphomonadaceae bacterium]|nr:heavy metal translocating P-type ATPase [Hyphomonadaceae bacterium]
MALTLASDQGCPSGLAPPDTEFAGGDPAAFVRLTTGGEETLELMAPGAKCAGCIRKIEGALKAVPGVTEARLNLSTQRLRVTWKAHSVRAAEVVRLLNGLGYRVQAFDPEAAEREVDETGRKLLRYIAVVGFAAMNIMMFSWPIWFGQDMGDGTRTAFHWVSALIAIPASLYAAQPFFASAYAALKARRANMDVPISLAVVLTLSMSVAETLQQGEHAYFDGITMLLLFLLTGRYLDHQLRQRARTAARDLLAMQAVTATRLAPDGSLSAVSARDIAVGDRLLLAAGDRAPVDGVVEEGQSETDCSMLTGETLPVRAQAGTEIRAGVINLTQKLVVRATARAADSSVAQLARLIEAGEQNRARFVRLADRAAALYVPVVHSLAALTFFAWLFGPIVLRAFGVEVGEVGFRQALMNAVAVLIITCPCALGLAVPAVQVVATGRLFKRGVLVKSGDALERLAEVDTIVFDKTGTLTLGKPRLITAAAQAELQAAASLARASRHPLSRALVEAAGPGVVTADAREVPGEGVEGTTNGRRARLGRRAFAAPDAPDANDGLLELWFTVEGAAPMRLAFDDALRADAADVVRRLLNLGYGVELLSGDRAASVVRAAAGAGIAHWRAGVSPAEKTARLNQLREAGHRTLMVGDGLNDAGALASAHASASPGTAIEASQAAADIVFQGAALAPLVEALAVAKQARQRALENLRFSALYNIIAAPTAAAGLLTPLIAALAMSGSSLIVTLNALRLQGWRPRWTS